VTDHGSQGGTVHGRSGSRSAAAVKQLLSRLRCSWRRRAARFGYDLHSYSQNFDDGIATLVSPAATECA
jgi:hypothetical protein